MYCHCWWVVFAHHYCVIIVVFLILFVNLTISIKDLLFGHFDVNVVGVQTFGTYVRAQSVCEHENGHRMIKRRWCDDDGQRKINKQFAFIHSSIYSISNFLPNTVCINHFELTKHNTLKLKTFSYEFVPFRWHALFEFFAKAGSPSLRPRTVCMVLVHKQIFLQIIFQHSDQYYECHLFHEERIYKKFSSLFCLRFEQYELSAILTFNPE